MIGYIYKTTNLINERVYIGKHCVSEYDPSYYGSGKLLKRAIKKYGKENFKNELLLKAETETQLNELEKKQLVNTENCLERNYTTSLKEVLEVILLVVYLNKKEMLLCER